jgi:GntR family transcriptional repressor for pyruvate dehydrogenase complex
MQNTFDPIFSEYKSRRASDDIADQIKNAILDGKFHHEDRLPSERLLASQFNVSRLTVREALRLLEAKGLIYIKKGSTGGAFFQSESQEQIASIIIDKLQLDGITIDHVIETRVILEKGMIRCIAENANEKDIALLEKNLEKLVTVKKKRIKFPLNNLKNLFR